MNAKQIKNQITMYLMLGETEKAFRLYQQFFK